MKLTLWGTRGSLATPGPETMRYGGNTSCAEVRTSNGTVLILDAGTGIRRAGAAIGKETSRVDILLTHLHMDHIQGLGFFAPLYIPGFEVHIWGPPSATLDLRARLSRYLSPPLFPVRLRDLPCDLRLHDVVSDRHFSIRDLEIHAALVCHPGPTVGYRVSHAGRSVVYLPDHEPALGGSNFPNEVEWTSGTDLAANADLLIHDAQYTSDQYAAHVGWGHSTIDQAFAFARLTGAKCLVPFHHDPDHSDEDLDRLFRNAVAAEPLSFDVQPAREGATFDLS